MTKLVLKVFVDAGLLLAGAAGFDALTKVRSKAFETIDTFL